MDLGGAEEGREDEGVWGGGGALDEVDCGGGGGGGFGEREEGLGLLAGKGSLGEVLGLGWCTSRAFRALVCSMVGGWMWMMDSVVVMGVAPGSSSVVGEVQMKDAELVPPWRTE